MTNKLNQTLKARPLDEARKLVSRVTKDVGMLELRNPESKDELHNQKCTLDALAKIKEFLK